MTTLKIQRMANEIIKARVEDVVKRIEKKINNPSKRQEMIEKVETYDKTKDPRDDIDLHESALLYPQDELGDEYQVGKREVDIDWTSHAQYRSDLRDVNPDKVTDAILDLVEAHPSMKNHDKIKLVKPFGKVVVDVDGRLPGDVEADVITVMN
ncbi:MAG: hypothetical protein WCR96_00750 [Candidatus Methanomethylophilaceae archaeon]